LAARALAAPDANEEYLIYQTLVGAWPFEADADTAAAFVARVVSYMQKALREAKVHTSWLSPDEAYEAAVERFVVNILDRQRPNAFLHAFVPFQARVAQLGIYNSLAQLVIKVTAPGVPDFYQGTEFWDFNLVDPDNRRPVDYVRRRQQLDEVTNASPEDLLASRADGRVKISSCIARWRRAPRSRMSTIRAATPPSRSLAGDGSRSSRSRVPGRRVPSPSPASRVWSLR